MGFSRVFICPTDKYKKFLAGRENTFESDHTAKAENALFVAITRARFSAVFLYDGDVNLEGVEVWSGLAE